MKPAYVPLPEPCKGRYPFRLACPSFIYPDHIVPNVRMLGPFVDEIELLLFESEPAQYLPSIADIETLSQLAGEFDIRYNVHLPTDICLAAGSITERVRAADTVKRVIDLTAGLNPTTCTLHLPYTGNGYGEDAVSRWEAALLESCEKMLDTGIDPAGISLETLDYPLHLLDRVISHFGFSVCLDLGHLLLYGEDPAEAFSRYGDITTMIHLHGVDGGKDHLALSRMAPPVLTEILAMLKGFDKSLSLEVFSYEKLTDSLQCLNRFWALASRGGTD